MNIAVILPGCLVAGIAAAMVFFYLRDRWEWNGGISRSSGKPWVAMDFDMDGRAYTDGREQIYLEWYTP